MWILVAFLNPLLHGLANIIDNYLVNRLFERKTTLMFYVTFLNILFLPPLFLFFGLPDIPSVYTALIFLGLAFINVIYLYPYYKALEQEDTSHVIALFSLGKVFVPVLAYFLVGEVLTLIQYVGIAIIVLASIGLSYQAGARLKLSSSLWWMLLCTFILSFEAVLYKLVFESVDWVTGFSWPVILSFLFAFPLLLVPKVASDIRSNWPRFKANLHVFTLGELATFLGIAAGTYAIAAAPVSVVKAIMSVEPIFVLLYAGLFSRMFPNVFKEKIDKRSVLKKLGFFIIIALGVVLAVSGEVGL